MILATAEEIAEAVKRILKEHSSNQEQPSFEDEKMTAGEAAYFIGVSYPTILKWIKQKKVRKHGSGRTGFLLKSELIQDYKNLK